MQQFAAVLLPLPSAVFHADGSFLAMPWKIVENRTLKWGSSPPRAEMPIFKWLFLNNLGSRTLGQIQNLDPHRLKPVFMLAEWESRDLHAEAFDLTYA